MKGKVTVLVAIGALAIVSGALAATIEGTPGDDRLRGTLQADVIRAFAGNDFVNARAGNDLVRAGAGDDVVQGDNGSDMIFGGAGSDRIRAGPADDVAWGGSGGDAVRGGEGPDELHGGSGDDTVGGGPGDDRLWAGPGNDVVHGGPGDDTLHALAADGDPDTLDCGPGRDTAKVRGSERATTTFRGCETVVVVVTPTGRRRGRRGGSRRGRGVARSVSGQRTGELASERGVAERPRVHHLDTIRSPAVAPAVDRASRPCAGEMAKILIIEDDDVIAQGMARHLHAAGFDAVGVANGETGLARLRYERPDVCVLDLMLPGLDGWKVIEQARGEGIGTPIVVVSARGTEHDRVHALEIGADDYLVKPFSMKELVARVGAAARRGTRAQDPRRGEEIVIEELRLDPKNVQAYVDGQSADLTPTEFRLLYALALETGRVLTRDELLQRVWGRRASHRDRTVDVFVRKLREKIDSRASRHTFLQTRYGVGYKLEAEPK